MLAFQHRKSYLLRTGPSLQLTGPGVEPTRTIRHGSLPINSRPDTTASQNPAIDRVRINLKGNPVRISMVAHYHVIY